MGGGSGGSGSGGRSGGGGSTNGDAGQPGEVVREANKAMTLDQAQRAYSAAADKHGDLLIRQEDGEKGLDGKIAAALAEKKAMRAKIAELKGGRF